MLVRIVQGGYGLKINGRNRLVLAGQTAELPDDEAARLLSLGVAVDADPVVTAEKKTAVMLNDPDYHNIWRDDEGEATADAETHPPDVSAVEAGNDTPDGENATEGQETAHLDEADLMANYTVAQLKALAAEMEVDVSKCKNKSEIAAAIAAVEVVPGPDLSAEAPSK